MALHPCLGLPGLALLLEVGAPGGTPEYSVFSPSYIVSQEMIGFNRAHAADEMTLLKIKIFGL